MLRALKAALVSLSLICPGTAAAQGQSDPGAVAAATELVVVMRIPDGLIHSLPGMLQMLKPLVTRGKPESERDFDVAAPGVVDAMKARIAEFMAPIAGVYARNFTISEDARGSGLTIERRRVRSFWIGRWLCTGGRGNLARTLVTSLAAKCTKDDPGTAEAGPKTIIPWRLLVLPTFPQE